MYIDFAFFPISAVIVGSVILCLALVIRDRSSEIRKLTEYTCNQEQILAEQKRLIEQLTQQIEHLKNSLNNSQQKIAEQDKLTEQLIKEIKRLTDSLNTAQDRAETAEKQADQLQNEVSKQDRLLKHLTQSNIQLTDSLNIARDRAETAEESLRASENVNQVLSKQVEQLTQAKQSLEDQTEQLEKDVAFYSDIKAASEGMNEEEEGVEITLEDLDEEQRAAFDLMTKTNENLFITGKAGTGKSALLKVFAKETSKCILKLAPTGMAAINIGGTTLHSAFGFDNITKLDYDRITDNTLKLSSDQRRILKNVVSIIIDEVSMVRSDNLEKMDRILKVINGNDRPFGGKQMILFGDLFQLPPVAKEPEQLYLNDKFGGIYFFNSDAYERGQFRFIELTINHRQTTDQHFFDILNNIREGTVTDAELDQINSRTNFEQSDLRVVTRLFAKKPEAETFNRLCLERSPGREYVNTAKVLYPEDGIYPHKENNAMESNLPISEHLRLKKGSLVMFVKNNRGKWANGTIGIVSEIYETHLRISINNEEHDVFPTEFEELEAKYKNGRIAYQLVCKVSQYPVVLAYAITIHKAQGQTYGKIACDVSDCFAPGQAYVALSRVKSLDGLFLLRKVERHQIQVDSNINKFYVKNKIQSKSPDEKTAEKFRRAQEASFEIVSREGTSYRIRSGKNIYLTSSDRCTCSAFKYDPNRSTSPCKHMIWLAYHTGVLPSYYQNP